MGIERSRAGRPPRAPRVLGIDPGTRWLGWGVVEFDRALAPRAVGCGVLRLPAGLPLAERLARTHVALRDLIAEHKPGALALEAVYHGKNFQSVLRVGESRGVVLMTAAEAGLEIVEFPPATVKLAVTGNGRASKEQVARMVVRLLGLERAPERADASDALAIAFCQARRLRGGAFPAAAPRRGRRRGGITSEALQALLHRLHLHRGADG